MLREDLDRDFEAALKSYAEICQPKKRLTT